MDRDDLLELICDPARSIDEVGEVIEERLKPVGIDADLLLAVRARLRLEGEAAILRGMLVGARQAPLGTASALDIYGMWITRMNIRQIDLNLLRVAAWAYHWAGDDLGWARALANLADGLFVRDEFGQALDASRKAVVVFMHHEMSLGIWKCLMVQANALAELHQADQADVLYQKVQDSIEAEGAALDNILLYIDILNARGFAAENLRDNFAQAQKYYNQADQLLPLAVSYSANVFRLKFNYGLLQMRLGRHAEARYLFDVADTWLEQGIKSGVLSSPDAYDLRQAQLSLALLLGDRHQAQLCLAQLQQLAVEGDISAKQQAEINRLEAFLSKDIDKAEPLLRKAAEQFQQLGASLLAYACWAYLAERAYEENRSAVAQEALREARTLLADRQVPRRQLELDRIVAQHEHSMPITAQEEVARRLSDQGDMLGAAAVWGAVGRRHEVGGCPHAAFEAYLRAMEEAEHARGLVRLSLHTVRLSTTWRSVAARAFVLAPDEHTACTISERARSYVLLDEIGNAGLWRLLERSDLSEIRSAYTQLTYEQARLSLRETWLKRPTMRDEQHSSEAWRAISEARGVAESAYFAALERVEAAKIAQAGWISGQSASPEVIRAALPLGGLLIAFSLIDTPQGSELWAMLLPAEGAPSRALVASRRQWRVFRERWAKGSVSSMSEMTTDQANATLQELYLAFLKQLESAIKGATHLLVALEDGMPRYPLHAAHDGKQYMIERLPVSYVPSGSVLALLRQRHINRAPPAETLVAGWDAVGEDRFPALPDLPMHLGQIADLLGGQIQTGPFNPDDLQACMARSRQVHLMCHGEFPDEVHPRFAQLVTGPRRLYADDLYRAELPADLLFLDACHSGQVGPGLQGFVGAALVAGASAVIAAMWQVEYRVARPLVLAFYRYWRGGSSAAEALRLAQQEQCRSPRQHPGHWAHFYLTGLPDLNYRSTKSLASNE